MADELELKAVIPDPAALRARLVAAGGRLQLHGRMSDRRYDRGGELTARDEVLRVRSYHHADGRTEAAAQEDPGRPVRACGECDRRCADIAFRCGDPGRAPVLEQHGVDDRVGEDREVLAGTRLVDVRERRVPACRPDDVEAVPDGVVTACIRERAMPRREPSVLPCARPKPSPPRSRPSA